MSQSLFPRVPVRLEASQWAWIGLGLAVIRREWNVAQTLHVYASAAPASGPSSDSERYEPDALAMIVRLASLSDQAPRRRQQALDARELAAAILGVRVARTYLRHGHLAARCRPPADSRRLLRRLERLRKVAKRKAQKQGGSRFIAESLRWRRFVHWLRMNLLYCRCKQRRAQRVGLSYARVIFESVLRLVRAALAQLRLRVAARRERRLASDALRQLRRGRAGLSVRDFMEDSELGLEYLAEYLKARFRKGNLYA